LFVSTTAVAVAAAAAAVVAIDTPIAVFVVATPAAVTVAVVVAAITVAATAGNAVGGGGGAELMGAIHRPLAAAHSEKESLVAIFDNVVIPKSKKMAKSMVGFSKNPAILFAMFRRSSITDPAGVDGAML
jgi:hypothetical protein